MHWMKRNQTFVQQGGGCNIDNDLLGILKRENMGKGSKVVDADDVFKGVCAQI